MNINYPFYFTLGGKGIDWRLPMNRRSIGLEYVDGTNIRLEVLQKKDLYKPFRFSEPVSGYFEKDNQKIRVTNLRGYDGITMLKLCPGCNSVKTLIEFDESGRDVNGPRDQSNCSNCRTAY